MTPPALRPVYAAAGRSFTLRRYLVELPPEASEIFDGSARVGVRECRVRSLAAPGRDLLQVSGAGAFSLPHGEDRIDIDPEPGAADAALEEALLGPALALALARRGVFVLHASAVVIGGGVVGFLGESGAGKSTLARLLAAEGLPRAADDLLAVTEGPAALPHFPQLKLGAAEMASIAGLEPRYPLLGLYELAPGEEVAAEPLPPVGAAALLLKHTVAGRLFSRDLLSAHLSFVSAIASRLPVHRLTVPRRMDVGPEVLAVLPG
jgi:hypothetical protein